ncbi:MAG TPA: class I SAM-dependent methyltransferase [Burkholderiales bacterium]|nr:class I SAM-dependent methyltransferase [Burkholderiales bacterium]
MNAGPAYLTDVEYTGNFYQFLTPAWLGYIAAINGYPAPVLDGRFTYCELGCGKGLTSLLLSAMHPNGEFHACDFNSAHIGYAGRLRNEAGIDNVAFHDKSFSEMIEADLPDFDFIVLHGVYSWVPEAVRAEIREFARRKLKPGGLVMASYNAMPGWAHVQPIRRMMHAYAEALPGDSLEKARAAFAYVHVLARTGAGYFKANPAAIRHLEQIAKQDIRYVAHEYLTQHGDPFYFSDVQDAMASAGLHYAGSMTPANNYPELMVPAAFRTHLPAQPSRSALEMHFDFIANTSFRPDLYTNQPALARPDELSLERLEPFAFCLANLAELLPLRAENAALKFDLSDQEGAVRSIHALLANGPARAAEIHRAGGKDSEAQTAFLIQQLVVAGHLAPCSPVRPPVGWMKINVALIEAGIREQWQEVPLACPATGAGSYSETVHAAAIEAAALFDDAGVAARSVLQRLRQHEHPVNRTDGSGERKPATDQQILEYISATWRSLNDRSNPNARLLYQFGLLKK